MLFPVGPRAAALQERLLSFMDEHVYPHEHVCDDVSDTEGVRAMCEIMGRSPIAPEIFNCSAPDTGNMEILARFGTAEQQRRWLEPLLAGEMRSAFAMTEPAVASSDATNIACRIDRERHEYVINGLKWWTTGAADPRCTLLIVMGKTDPSAERGDRRGETAR